MPKVLIAEPLPREIYVPLFEKAGIEFLDGVPSSRLEELIKECDGLIVRSGTKVNPQLLSKARKLRIIARAGTGYDNIDLEAATAQGIVVMNTPDANSEAAAEHTMALIYALARNISQADASTKAGNWERGRYTGVELKGKRLGVVGLGKVGGLVAQLARGNGMSVVFYDPYVPEEKAKTLGLTSLSLDELLGASDYVTLHLPLTDETEGIIGSRALALMKGTACLLNVARGELVDEKALYDALSSGKISRAAVDVFAEEPYKGKLLELGDKIIVTPHLGASTQEAQARVAESITRQVIAFFNEGKLINAVNVSPFSQEIRPYLALVERMGYFVSGLVDGPINAVKVECYGELSGVDVTGMSVAGLVGLLSKRFDSVNLVNATSIAKQFGIQVTEAKSTEQIDYRNLVSLEVSVSGQAPVRVQGILYEKKGPRIVGLNGYNIEFEPSGILLISTHADVPGVVGNLGSVLGGCGVNIATISLSREAQKGIAVGVLRVDSEVPEEVLQKLTAPAQNGEIYSVKQITVPEMLPPRL